MTTPKTLPRPPVREVLQDNNGHHVEEEILPIMTLPESEREVNPKEPMLEEGQITKANTLINLILIPESLVASMLPPTA